MSDVAGARHRTGRRCRGFVLAFVALAAPASFAAGLLPQIDDPQVQACLDRTLPQHSMRQTLAIQTFDTTGSVVESRGTLLWKRDEEGLSKLLVRLTEPPLRAGIAILAIERGRKDPDIYLYLPELRQTRRVTGRTFSGSMLGTDFSYEDYTQFHGIAQSNTIERLPDGTLDGQAVYVVALTPGNDQSAYSRIVTYVDQTRCLPLKTEFFDRGGELHKELTIDPQSIREAGTRFVPYHVVMYDRRQGSRTDLVVDEMEVDVDLSDGQFAPSSLAYKH